MYEGTWNNAHQVAVKQLKKGMMDSSDFLREAKIMKDLRHPNLIQLYAVGRLSSVMFNDLWTITPHKSQTNRIAGIDN